MSGAEARGGNYRLTYTRSRSHHPRKTPCEKHRAHDGLRMTAASAALTRLSPAQAGCVPPQSLRSTVARQFIPDNKFSVLRMRSMSLLPHVCPRGMRHVRDIRRLHFLSLRTVPGQDTARNSIKVMPPLRPLRRTPGPSVSMWRLDSTT